MYLNHLGACAALTHVCPSWVAVAAILPSPHVPCSVSACDVLLSLLTPRLSPTHHRHHVMAEQNLTAAATGVAEAPGNATAVQTPRAERTRVMPARRRGLPDGG
jgi:hypothetical protein